ncbi:hypothetical protein JOQ06_018217, partial [Pogonophryne albipinna]
RGKETQRPETRPDLGSDSGASQHSCLSRWQRTSKAQRAVVFVLSERSSCLFQSTGEAEDPLQKCVQLLLPSHFRKPMSAISGDPCPGEREKSSDYCFRLRAKTLGSGGSGESCLTPVIIAAQSQTADFLELLMRLVFCVTDSGE